MKIKNILLSQVAPADIEKTPYAELRKKYSINLDFYKFFKFEGIPAVEFRQTKINILNHTAVVFSSTTAIDYFFTLVKDLRVEMPENMKYFCVTDTAAYYLQKYIPYRKRKIFYAKNNQNSGLFELLLKNRELKFLLPCGNGMISTQYSDFFDSNNIEYTQAVIFNTVAANIKEDIDISKYNMIVFFSPSGVQAFKTNFPDFEQGEMAFAAMGPAAVEAIEAEGWTLHVAAPTKEAPSITTALDIFLKDHATRRR